MRRSDYIALDRKKLAYLNAIEKGNCDYCSYANGLLAYIREISARTEQYGDAEGYKRELPMLRKALSRHDDRDRQKRSRLTIWFGGRCSIATRMSRIDLYELTFANSMT